MKRSPKLWRRKKGGKEVGNFFVTVKDVPINLGTKDAGLAMKRRPMALKGRRVFEDDVDAAAEDVVAHVAPPAPEQNALAVVPPPLEPDDEAIDADEVIPPPPLGSPGSPPPPAEGWADTVGAAAGDDAAADEAPAAPASTPIDPAFLDGMLEQAAAIAVELQLYGQEWLAARFAKRQAGKIPEDFPLRGAAQKVWVAQFKRWMPTDIPLPEWAIALVLVAACAPIQIATGTPLPDDGKKAAGSAAAA